MPTFSAPREYSSWRSTPKGKLSWRNLPYTFLVLAMILGFIALIILLAGSFDMAKEGDLKSLAGSVQRAPSWVHTKGGPVVVIHVETDDGQHSLFEEDLSHSREIMNLKPGDHVTARVRFLFGEYDIWELERDGVTIESYQDAYLYQTRLNERGTTNALWLGLISSIFLMVALVLRMHFGAWQDSTPWVSADAADYVERS
jgi:hypothetical protein